jgi:hypothetical protein
MDGYSLSQQAPWKQAAQVDLDPSSLVPIPTLPPHLLSLVPHSSRLGGQDARSAKLPVSPSPSGSPYIKSPPHRLGSGGQDGYLEPCSLLPFKMLDPDFPAMEGASLAPWDPVVLQVREDKDAGTACGSSIGREYRN